MKTKGKVILALSVVAVAVTGIVLWRNRNKGEDTTDTDLADTSSTSSGSSSSSSLPSTPFKNKAEGDAFRNWIVNTYPIYATSIVLDRTGAYDNNYIRKAYVKYGADYSKVSMLTGVKFQLSGWQEVSLKGDYVSAEFNSGDYRVKFYNNGRYAIWKKAGWSWDLIQKGSFSSNGNRLIVTDGLNSGKTFENTATRTNILNAIK